MYHQAKAKRSKDMVITMLKVLEGTLIELLARRNNPHRPFACLADRAALKVRHHCAKVMGTDL
jgi:hypothetical protein